VCLHTARRAKNGELPGAGGGLLQIMPALGLGFISLGNSGAAGSAVPFPPYLSAGSASVLRQMEDATVALLATRAARAYNGVWHNARGESVLQTVVGPTGWVSVQLTNSALAAVLAGWNAAINQTIPMSSFEKIYATNSPALLPKVSSASTLLWAGSAHTFSWSQQDHQRGYAHGYATCTFGGYTEQKGAATLGCTFHPPNLPAAGDPNGWYAALLSGGFSPAMSGLSKASAMAYTWQPGAWGSCSATCGNGTRTRAVPCVTPFEAPGPPGPPTSMPTPPAMCSGEASTAQPPAEEACNAQPCPTPAPVPTPAPTPVMYSCNATTGQCSPDPTGSLSPGECIATCKSPPPTPVPTPTEAPHCAAGCVAGVGAGSAVAAACATAFAMMRRTSSRSANKDTELVEALDAHSDDYRGL
jgi:hypothetical protein